MKIHPAACIAHNAAQPQPKTRRQIRRRACFVAPRCHHKAKVKLGPTRSFGRDALRRVLSRDFCGLDMREEPMLDKPKQFATWQPPECIVKNLDFDRAKIARVAHGVAEPSNLDD